MNREYYIAKVPSNIAFIKYWGKRETAQQWPANDSLSMTLKQSFTSTKAQVTNSAAFEVFFQGHQLFETDPFARKSFLQLKYLARELGFQNKLKIESKNTFPSGCGIASSASGMGALTLSALAAWTKSNSLTELQNNGFTLEKIAMLARIGSGSACRSFHGGYVLWHAGEAAELQQVKQIATEQDWKLADIIAVVSNQTKKTSSTQAHALAWTSPLFHPRLAGLSERMQKVQTAISNKDFEFLGETIENEALELHAIAMSGRQPINYFTEQTPKILSWIRRERSKGIFQAYFTLDAGPNIHILALPGDRQKISVLLAQEFPGVELLQDETGAGSELVNDEGE